MTKTKFHAGGRAGKKAAKRKTSTAGKIVLGLVTCLNLGLGLAVSLLNRREVLHAVQENEDVKLLLTQRAKTCRKEDGPAE